MANIFKVSSKIRVMPAKVNAQVNDAFPVQVTLISNSNGHSGRYGSAMSGDGFQNPRTKSANNGRQAVGIEASMSQSMDVKSSVLSCHGICYDVFVKDKACCGKLNPKRILKNIE
jgi:hypothetical protein